MRSTPVKKPISKDKVKVVYANELLALSEQEQAIKTLCEELEIARTNLKNILAAHSQYYNIVF